MSGLTDAAGYAQDARLVGPLRAAIARVAVETVAEDPATAEHWVRASLAAEVLRAPAAHVDAFAWATSTNDTLVRRWAGDDLDAVHAGLQAAVAAVWNAVAGVVAT